MNPRKKGTSELAFMKMQIIMRAAYKKAIETGANPDDIIYEVYSLATHKKDHPFQAKATRESAFELRLRQPLKNEEMPDAKRFLSGRLALETDRKNPKHQSGHEQAPNNIPRENHPSPENQKREQAAMKDHCKKLHQGIEGCPATSVLHGFSPQTICSACSQNDIPADLPLKADQARNPALLQNQNSFHQGMKNQLSCLLLQLLTILLEEDLSIKEKKS